MATRVELEVSDNGLSFLLDDAVKGVLDNTTYTLRNAWADISEWVYSVNIKRGRNREYDRFSAGTLQVELRNHERTFDPTYAFSPFFGEIFPRRMIRVFTDDVVQFVGFVEDWEFSYSPGGESLVSVSASDAFTKFSQFELQDVAVTEQLTGARVNTILNEFGWPASDRGVDVGSSVVAAGTASGSALSYLQQVETSELGYMFMGKDGSFEFRQRNNALGDYVSSVSVRTNLVTNPSFEVNTTGWTASAGVTITRSTSEYFNGSASMSIACPSVGNFVRVNPYLAVSASQTYTFSVYVKAEAGKLFRLQLAEYTSADVQVGSLTLGSDITGTGSWQRVDLSRTFGSTGVKAGLVFQNRTSGAHTFYVDAVQLEVGSTASNYFDGSTTDTSSTQYDWTALENASTSTATTTTVTYTPYIPVEFSDDGSGVGFDSVDVSYSTDTMSNQAFVAWSGGTVVANTISTPVYEVRRNYVSNPSFETNAALWSGNDDQGRPASIVRVSGGWVGSYAGYASCNYNSAFMQVTSYAAAVDTGAAYTLSMYVKPQVTRTVYPVMSFFLSTGGYFYIEGTPVTCPSTSWTRVSVSGFAHSDATNILAGFVVDSPIAKFETVAFDGVLLEKSATLGSYFDGSFTDTSVWDYSWVATAHASESTATRLVSAGSDSQTKYGVISRDVETLLASESTATEFAQYFVARYSEPEYNVNAVTVTLDRSSEDAAKLLSLDIGDLVSIRFTPNGVGEPIVKLAEVLKLEHSISIDRHVMTVGISGKQFIGFTLDSVEFGILDTDMLAF